MAAGTVVAVQAGKQPLAAMRLPSAPFARPGRPATLPQIRAKPGRRPYRPRYSEMLSGMPVPTGTDRAVLIVGFDLERRTPVQHDCARAGWPYSANAKTNGPRVDIRGRSVDARLKAGAEEIERPQTN
jgi:hypothetical protein